MDSPFECKDCPGQWVSTASRQEEANNCSLFKLKEVKVVLRDIHEPRSSLPKEHLQSLCESCRPRRTGYQSVAEHASRCKRGCRRKSCEELLKSWKAPTRRHRLPRHLRDFVVDSTILHLIEFSNWYNRGQIARQYEPAEDLLAEQRGVTPRGSRPDIGKMKRKRTDMREHALNKLKKERNRKRCQPTSSSSCSVSRARKQKPRCPDKTKTVLPEPKHRGRPKTCNNAPQIRSASSSSLAEPKHQSRQEKCKVALQIMTASLSSLQHRGRPKKCKHSSQTMPATSSRVAKNKPRGRAKKCKDTPQTKCTGASSSALTVPKHRGRPKKCKHSSQMMPATSSRVAKNKPRGRAKNCKETPQTKCTGASSSALTVPKHRGRPKKCKDTPHTKCTAASSSALTVPKHRGRPKKCKDTSQTMPATSSRVAKNKPRGRAKKCKNTPQTKCTAASLSALTVPKHRGRPKKCKKASGTPPSVTTVVVPKHRGRPKKDKNAPKTKSASLPHSTAFKHPSRPKKCEVTTAGIHVIETECSPQQPILEKLASKVNCHVESSKCKDLAGPCPQNHKTTKQASQARKKCLSAVDTKGSDRPKKRKCCIVTSSQDGQKTLENEQACTQRLPPSINPDFSIADSDTGMNIDEYLVQLGTYLERTDCCESTTVGIANEVEEGLCDKNNNLVTDSEILQKRDAGALQSHGGIIDVGTTDRMGIDPRDEFHDANNNLISNADILQGSDTGRRRSDSGISDVSYDLVRVSRSKRTRRPQKRREQSSSDRLNLRRSERLRVKEDYRRCNELWTDKGNHSKAGRSSRGNLSGRESRYHHESLKTSLDDDLLQEFVAMCPLDGDLPFSDEECLSLLVESPIISGNGWSTSCFARLDDQGLGSQAVDAICPRNPPKVRRSLGEFLLDEYSVHLLASRPIRSPPGHGRELGQDTAQECAGVSPGALEMGPGFGPLTDNKVTLLRQLGLDATQEELAGDWMEDVTRSDGTPPVVSQPTAQSSQESNFSNQDLGERNLQEMEEQIKDQSVGGAWESLKLPHQKGPMVVIPSLHSGGQTVTIAAAEVWLPSCVAEFSANNVFFMPMGEWSVKDRAWHVQKVLWRNLVDGGWHISEVQEDVVVGTCFVPEEVWLVSQGARGKTRSRVYDIRPLSKRPGADGCPDPRVPVTASCHSSRYVNPLKPARRKPKKRQCVPIPGVPLPFDMQSCRQPSMALHPTNPYPLIMPMPIRFSCTPNMVYSNGAEDYRPGLPIPVFDQQQEPGLLETSAAIQDVVQHPSSYIENSFCLMQQDTSGHFIGLDGYLAMTHDHSYCTSSDVMDKERTSLLTEKNGATCTLDSVGNDCRNNLQGTLSASRNRDRAVPEGSKPFDVTTDIYNNNYNDTRDTAVPEGRQPFNVITDINNNNSRDTGVSQRDQSAVMITDINNNNIVSGTANKVDTNEHGLSEVAEIFPKVPSSVQEAVDQIHACKEVTDLGQLLLQWCKSDVSFRRHNQVLAGIADRLERGSGNQFSQNFCVFAASFHAVSQKDDYIPDYEDECVLVQLGLSAVSQCLAQDRQEQAQNQVQSQPLQVQLQQAQCHPMEAQDLPVPAQVQSRQGQRHAMRLQDQQRLVQAHPHPVQNPAMEVQSHPVQNPSMEVQDKRRLAEVQSHPVQDQLQNQVQNQAVQVQAQPREDAYCILQMLLHLKLPLTEVLASMSLRSFHDLSLGLPETVDCSAVRDVLGVLADFDPAMAFNVIQGLGWGHTVLEVSQEKEEFDQQLVALAEALLDCKKFWQCRVLLCYLNAYECCRQPCRHLYSSLLGKLLDTQTDYEPAMMVFEDMMESYLIVPAPILSKLLTLMWKRTDDEGMEDALCVFHYGLGLGLYPMYRKVEDGVWEATVFVGATDAEVFFSLKTLLEEVHHQQDGPLEGGSGGIGGAVQDVQDASRVLPGQKSLRFAGSGRCGAKRQTVREGSPQVVKKKGRTMALAGQDVEKQAPRKTSVDKKGTRVRIRLVEPQHVQRGDLPIPDDATSNDGFSRMLSMKHTIQDVVENYFHPLAITPSADGWSSHRRMISCTLAINEDALQSWLIAQGRRETTYLVID